MAKKKSEAALEKTPPAAEATPNYTVVARRYRPKQFSSLIGQESVGQALANAIKTNRVAHAYLFTGARGVGKTSAARILAKCLNCEKGPTPTPCDECDICRSISSGEDIDVLEIDGASNRGIDEIRAIRQNVQTRPSRGRFKIYIIDEIHMLSVQAFNALLKTLEEPPAHVKFIFATTEVQKIPITILSRCQRFDFGIITTAKIAACLTEVVKAEGMQAEPEAIQFIARRAAGSMRDAQSLLDQLLSYAQSKTLTAQQVYDLLGTAGEERILPLVEAIFSKDPTAALKTLSTFTEEGTLLTELLDQLIEFWRQMMIVNCGGLEAVGDFLPDRTREMLSRHAKASPIDAILAGLDVLTSAKAKLRNTNYPQLTLEMALVRLCRLEELISVGQLTQMLQSGEVAPRPATAPSTPALPADKKKTLSESVSFQLGEPSKNGSGGLSVEQAWNLLLNNLPMLMANMNKAQRKISPAAHRIDLIFPLTSLSNYDYCNSPNSLERVERELQTHTGEKWSIRVELEAGARVEMPTGNGPGGTPSRQAREERLKTIPLTNRIIEKLNARVLQMDQGFGEELTPAPPEVPVEEI
ncbi:DNA polymerase III subunit gamma/tau [Telmatocola sphagniphila]|uniref:DNA polymerase III subunit gamma/tau n=1 Tax=Telmatocola sphagniphila TaxID=1123043 RepID=A0A8E6B9V7_9BACT|nr:DNA polymerase III subunit gamma/tau [Telmatocola sphagniphila]QVL34483.1 DNA polymerase III subunit gamma/tau [Telmatocola sphagniphila]